MHWSCLHRIKRGEDVANKDLVRLLILGRGLGKSSLLEAARVMRGAILNKGYSLIISETDDQAQEHLGNCRILIEHPDSLLTQYYPDMAIADNADALKGMPTADRKEMFICRNGFIVRGKGLSAKMRGLRVGIFRPDDILLDDVDDVNDSFAVSANKLNLITASILPVQARENVTVDVGQNLISEHSVVNQIFSGKSDALADRTVIGVANAFTKLDIESAIDTTGKMRHVIQPTSTPSWHGFSIIRAQKFLDNSGLSTFLAEYQNEFDQFRSGKVVPEYNEASQLISWSEFEAVYGQRRIPSHWQAKVGLDVGYSEGKYPHYSAWVFVATAGQNAVVPNAVFLYRTRSFLGTSIDDQAEIIKGEMWRDEQQMIRSWQMSHEKSGELLTLKQKHGLSFAKFTHYKAEDGVAQWRHMSRCDHTQPNPFKADEMLADDTYRLGRPQLFYIVDDEQMLMARDDAGARLFREQVQAWEYVTVKLTESGQSQQRPSKTNDDFCFIAGTLITTNRGDVPIEKIRSSDKVLTRDGFHSVVAHGLTNSSAKVATLNLMNGVSLTSTLNHPIFIQNKGFIPLSEVVSGDIIYPCPTQKKSISTESFLRGIPTRPHGLYGFISGLITESVSWVSRLYTERFGSFITTLFRQGMLFTTWTQTPSTTIFPTWNVFPLRITLSTTGNMILMNGSNVGERLPQKDVRYLKFGLKNQESDTALQQRLLSSKPVSHYQSEPWFVNSAAKVTTLEARHPNFAHPDADNVLTALVLKATVNTHYLASNVERNSELSSLMHNFAVKSVTIRAEPLPVYNLKIANQPEYFANGVLVHNCDSFKSTIVLFGPRSEPLTIPEQREDNLDESLKNKEQIIANNDRETAERMMLARTMAFDQMNKDEAKAKQALSRMRPQVPKIAFNRRGR